MTPAGNPSKERNYKQYCGLAAALDAIGERWTLLIVRELLLGPRRYNELLAELPGLGTNLLAERLKKLCALGIVEHKGSSAGAGRVYELAEGGQTLREPVMALSRWGMSMLGEPAADVVVRPQWGFLAVAAMADASALPDVREQYEFRVDEEVFHLSIDHGTAVAAKGPAVDAAMSITTDATTFIRIGAGMLAPFAAVASGKLALAGDPEAVLRCSAVLGLLPASVS